jgi:predicted AAA+ superfamily ATPase
MIARNGYLERVRTGLGRGPIVALIGPRQCGKTTLARQLMSSGTPGYQDAPRLTRSMRIAMDDLKLTELLVVYPGNREYALADGIRAVPLDAASAGPGLAG